MRNRFTVFDFPELFDIHTTGTITLDLFFHCFSSNAITIFQDCAKKISYSDVPWHIAQLAALEATLGQFASHRTWGALDVEASGGTRVP